MFLHGGLVRGVRRWTHEHGVQMFLAAIVAGVLVLVALLMYALAL